MQVPGVEHSCHNALAQITDKLTHFKAWQQKANAIGRCLSTTYYTDRLKRVCLASREAKWVADMVDGFSVVPDKGRFGNLMEFLDQILPLKAGLQRFYDDRAFRGDDDGEPQDAENSVDVNLVTAFIVDPEMWHYSTMLLALGAGWMELAYYSRGCACHRAKAVDAENTLTYYRRRQAQERETGQKARCPASGLHADEFAAGKALEVLRESTATYGKRLVTDMIEVTPAGRHRIMQDFDLGCDQSFYIGSLKFSTHVQLPLVLCGIANRDPSKAMRCAQSAIDQWKATSDSAAHDNATRRVFENEHLFAELENFAQTGSEESLETLPELIDEVDLVRYNELSVEGLHRLGTLIGQLTYRTICGATRSAVVAADVGHGRSLQTLVSYVREI